MKIFKFFLVLLSIIIVVATTFAKPSFASSPVGRDDETVSNGVLSELQIVYYRINNQVAQLYIDSGDSTAMPPGGLNTFCRTERKQADHSPLSVNNYNSTSVHNRNKLIEPVKTYFVRLDKNGNSQAVDDRQAKRELQGLKKEIHISSGKDFMKDCQKKSAS